METKNATNMRDMLRDARASVNNSGKNAAKGPASKTSVATSGGTAQQQNKRASVAGGVALTPLDPLHHNAKPKTLSAMNTGSSTKAGRKLSNKDNKTLPLETDSPDSSSTTKRTSPPPVLESLNHAPVVSKHDGDSASGANAIPSPARRASFTGGQPHAGVSAAAVADAPHKANFDPTGSFQEENSKKTSQLPSPPKREKFTASGADHREGNPESSTKAKAGGKVAAGSQSNKTNAMREVKSAPTAKKNNNATKAAQPGAASTKLNVSSRSKTKSKSTAHPTTVKAPQSSAENDDDTGSNSSLPALAEDDTMVVLEMQKSNKNNSSPEHTHLQKAAVEEAEKKQQRGSVSKPDDAAAQQSTLKQSGSIKAAVVPPLKATEFVAEKKEDTIDSGASEGRSPKLPSPPPSPPSSQTNSARKRPYPRKHTLAASPTEPSNDDVKASLQINDDANDVGSEDEDEKEDTELAGEKDIQHLEDSNDDNEVETPSHRRKTAAPPPVAAAPPAVPVSPDDNDDDMELGMEVDVETIAVVKKADQAEKKSSDNAKPAASTVVVPGAFFAQEDEEDDENLELLGETEVFFTTATAAAKAAAQLDTKKQDVSKICSEREALKRQIEQERQQQAATLVGKENQSQKKTHPPSSSSSSSSHRPEFGMPGFEGLNAKPPAPYNQAEQNGPSFQSMWNSQLCMPILSDNLSDRIAQRKQRFELWNSKQSVEDGAKAVNALLVQQHREAVFAATGTMPPPGETTLPASGRGASGVLVPPGHSDTMTMMKNKAAQAAARAATAQVASESSRFAPLPSGREVSDSERQHSTARAVTGSTPSSTQRTAQEVGSSPMIVPPTAGSVALANKEVSTSPPRRANTADHPPATASGPLDDAGFDTVQTDKILEVFVDVGAAVMDDGGIAPPNGGTDDSNNDTAHPGGAAVKEGAA